MGGAVILTAALAAWSPAGDWAGAVVFPREHELTLKDADGNPVGELQLTGQVVKAGPAWLLVRTAGDSAPEEGYADKAGVVPLGQAVAYFTARLAEDGEDFPALVKRAEARSLTGDHAGALADYDEVVGWWPHPALVNLRGLARWRAGDLAGADDDFTEVVGLVPDHPAGYANRGEVRHARKDFAGAASDYAKALACDPDLAEVYVARGKLRVDRQEYEGAVADFTDAVRLDPRDALAYYLRGLAWHRAGGFGDAAADYSEAIRLGVGGLDPLTNRARAWASFGETGRAEADYSAALRLAPARPELLRERGAVRANRADFAGAAADFGELARVNPADYQAHYWLGLARLKQGETGRAYLAFDECRRLAPAGSDFAQGAAHYREQAWARHAAYRDEIAAAEKAAAAAPDDAKAANDLAWLLATCPDGLHRDGKRAVGLATRACWRTGWRDAVCVGTLGAAQAEAGEFGKAAEYQARAMGDLGYFRDHGAKAIERLKGYEAGRPCREEFTAKR